MITKGYLLSVAYAALCLCIGFVMYKLRCPKPITRKTVHILVGFEWIILCHFLGSSIHFLVICLLFLAILILSHSNKMLPMIESDSDNSPGTVYYAVAMSVMSLIMLFIPNIMLPFGIGVFCTSFGDGFAGLVGQIVKSPKNKQIYGNKTICGTLTNFIVCCLAIGILNYCFNIGMNTWHIVATAFFATELELFTSKGLDNISVTLGASFLSYFLINYKGAENYLIPILLTPMIIALSYKKRTLTISGIIAAVVLELIVSFSLCNQGFILLLAFFAGGIFVDKVKKHYKKTEQYIEKRGDCRNWIQVASNGSVAAICAFLHLCTSNKVFLIAFAASLAEALADTTASGIGSLSNKTFDLCRMRKCSAGLSGGVSLLGTFASIIGAAVISFVGYAIGLFNLTDAAVILLAGFLGAIFDSVLGSLLQVKYKCQSCGIVTEREKHCECDTVKYRGIRLVNNDVVNFLGTLFAALIAALLH